MRGYRAIFSARFRTLLQYRAAAMAGIVTQLFWGAIWFMAFCAFYRSTWAQQPMALADTVTYLWLTQALLMLLPWRPDPEVEAMIRSGNIAYELVKPVHLYGIWFTRSLAQRTAPTMLRWPPVVIVAMLAFGMRFPDSWQSAGLFALGLMGAVLLGAAITSLLTISLLWTVSSRGVVALGAAAVNVFSGAIVPLPLFPGWAQTALSWQPFRRLMDTPFRLYMGHLSGRGIWLALLHQLGWTILLTLAGAALVRAAQRRLVVQGG